MRAAFTQQPSQFSAARLPPTSRRSLPTPSSWIIRTRKRNSPHWRIFTPRSSKWRATLHRPTRNARTRWRQPFADQYAQLAALQFSLGDYEAAIKANESGLACLPRDASFYTSIASAI